MIFLFIFIAVALATYYMAMFMPFLVANVESNETVEFEFEPKIRGYLNFGGSNSIVLPQVCNDKLILIINN